jgi:hypothetical protein
VRSRWLSFYVVHESEGIDANGDEWFVSRVLWVCEDRALADALADGLRLEFLLESDPRDGSTTASVTVQQALAIRPGLKAQWLHKRQTYEGRIRSGAALNRNEK